VILTSTFISVGLKLINVKILSSDFEMADKKAGDCFLVDGQGSKVVFSLCPVLRLHSGSMLSHSTLSTFRFWQIVWCNSSTFFRSVVPSDCGEVFSKPLRDGRRCSLAGARL
jgi:hypothetical protein